MSDFDTTSARRCWSTLELARPPLTCRILDEVELRNGAYQNTNLAISWVVKTAGDGDKHSILKRSRSKGN